MRYANPFAGHEWYPLMTVAVKAPDSGSDTDGSGTMALHLVTV